MKNTFSILILISMFSVTACQSLQQQDLQSAKQLVMVAGATGKTGKHMVKHLLDEGYPVRVLVRNQDKAKEMFADTVEIRVADITDAAAVLSATRGVTYVLSAIGSAKPAGPNSPEFVDYGGVKNMVEASMAAGVDHFVLVSSLGATKKDHRLNKMFGNVMVWKLKGEDTLRASSLNYTIVRPGGLTEDEGRQGALLFAQGDAIESGRISRDDVAEISVAALSNTSARGKTFEVIAEEGSSERDWSDLFGQLASD